jgi:2-polyprenyl-3-methyl-5-hydroxy-6-metoxy-1,4-benzoquinol methylase
MNAKTHWESIYSAKQATEVSWYQAHPQLSLDLIRHAASNNPAAAIIDVGGGASTLVDHLLDDGFTDVTVLDISARALLAAQIRLGERASRVTWIEADVTTADLPVHHFAVWHDRAVFHFLIDPRDRRRYVRTVSHAVKPDGTVIVATFADDGPTRCSGLKVARYSPAELHGEFGDEFHLLEHYRETHHTPFRTEQKFIYCLCRREPSS